MFCWCKTDSIEANVESAAAHVEDGTEQLRQARVHQVVSTDCWQKYWFHLKWSK
jgi:hypothetical protein